MLNKKNHLNNHYQLVEKVVKRKFLLISEKVLKVFCFRHEIQREARTKECILYSKVGGIAMYYSKVRGLQSTLCNMYSKVGG